MNARCYYIISHKNRNEIAKKEPRTIGFCILLISIRKFISHLNDGCDGFFLRVKICDAFSRFRHWPRPNYVSVCLIMSISHLYFGIGDQNEDEMIVMVFYVGWLARWLANALGMVCMCGIIFNLAVHRFHFNVTLIMCWTFGHSFEWSGEKIIHVRVDIPLNWIQ